MSLPRGLQLVILGLTFVACVAAAGDVAHAPLAVVGAIEPGQWQIKEIGTTTPPRSLCVNDPDMLVQLDHKGGDCSRFVIDDQPRLAVVSYICPAAGRGRTIIRLESPKDLRLETQGVFAGVPFDRSFHAHRLGPCVTSSR